MAERSTTSTSAIICSGLSFVVGAWALIKTQAVTKETFDPIVVACTSTQYATMEEFVQQTGYHPYDSRFGFVIFDFSVCLVTQFLMDLIKMTHPAGLIVWGTTFIVSLPVHVLCNLEAGRQNSRGFIVWPTLNTYLMQFIGVSIIFPALWVPSYTFWGGSVDGVVSMKLAKSVVYFSLPLSILAALVFYLDTDHPMWSICTGIFGGPMIPLLSLFVWFLPPPPVGHVSKEISDKTAEFSALSFAVAGTASLLAWQYIVYTALKTYGLDHNALLKDLWWETNPAVRFMTIDACVLWIGLLLHIGSRNLPNMGQALVATPLFGPGAACAMALVSIELDRLNQQDPIAEATPEIHANKKDQ